MADWPQQNQADGRWSVESGVQRRLQGVLTGLELEHSRNTFIPIVPNRPGLSSPFIWLSKETLSCHWVNKWVLVWCAILWTGGPPLPKKAMHSLSYFLYYLDPDLRLARVSFFHILAGKHQQGYVRVWLLRERKKSKVESLGVAALTASYRLHTHTHQQWHSLTHTHNLTQPPSSVPQRELDTELFRKAPHLLRNRTHYPSWLLQSQ